MQAGGGAVPGGADAAALVRPTPAAGRGGAEQAARRACQPTRREEAGRPEGPPRRPRRGPQGAAQGATRGSGRKQGRPQSRAGRPAGRTEQAKADPKRQRLGRRGPARRDGPGADAGGRAEPGDGRGQAATGRARATPGSGTAARRRGRQASTRRHDRRERPRNTAGRAKPDGEGAGRRSGPKRPGGPTGPSTPQKPPARRTGRLLRGPRGPPPTRGPTGPGPQGGSMPAQGNCRTPSTGEGPQALLLILGHYSVRGGLNHGKAYGHRVSGSDIFCTARVKSIRGRCEALVCDKAIFGGSGWEARQGARVKASRAKDGGHDMARAVRRAQAQVRDIACAPPSGGSSPSPSTRPG